LYVCMYESIYNAPLLQPKQSRVRAKFHSGLWHWHSCVTNWIINNSDTKNSF